MGVISNIKSKYKVNKNILWICNTVLLLLTALQYIAIVIGAAITHEWQKNIPLMIVLVLCVAVNVIDVLLNRKYIHLPVAIINIVVIAVSTYMLIISANLVCSHCYIDCKHYICGTSVLRGKDRSAKELIGTSGKGKAGF